MEGARDLGRRLHKNCSQAPNAAARDSEFGRTKSSWITASNCAIAESYDEFI
jgi:hypothetical protein